MCVSVPQKAGIDWGCGILAESLLAQRRKGAKEDYAVPLRLCVFARVAYLSPIAAVMAAMIGSVTRRLWSSSIFPGERSKLTGESSIRLIMVPSEKPASTKRMMPSLFNVGVFSSLGVALSPLSTGGLIIRTVADPVTLPSF